MTSQNPHVGKFACYLCGHDQYEHNLIVGCPHCRCAATPGEAGRDPSGKYEDLRIRSASEPPLHDWQRKRSPLPEADSDRATPAWVPTFVDWAEGRTETLDFGGKEVPERLQRLLTALEPADHVLTLTEDGWTVQHPLPCRPNLAECDLTLCAKDVSGSLLRQHGQEAYGKWRVVMGSLGWPQAIERIED